MPKSTSLLQLIRTLLEKFGKMFAPREKRASGKLNNHSPLKREKENTPDISRDRRLTRQALLKQYDIFLGRSLIASSHYPYFQILDDKIRQDNCGIRALFARLMANYGLALSKRNEFTEEEQIFFYEQLPFILECVISIQYYHNQILDGKAGVTTAHPERIKANLIDGNLLERELFNYVEFEVDERWKSKTADMLRLIFQLVDIGQKIEQEANLFEYFQKGGFVQYAFEKELVELNHLEISLLEDLVKHLLKCFKIPRNHSPFLYRYFERIYFVSSVLFIQATEIILDTLEVKQVKVQLTKKFASYFGIMMQIINDVTDCSLVENSLCTAGKNEDDAFADLKNSNLTFPILLHYLQFPEGKIGTFLKTSHIKIEEKEIEACYREMIENHSQYKAIELCRMLRDKALINLPDKNGLELPLKDLCTIADMNRCFYDLIQEKEYSNYRMIKRQMRKETKENCKAWQRQQ